MHALHDIFAFIRENSLLVTLLFTGLFLYISRRYGILFMKTEQPQETNYCNDQNCVRCNNYSHTVVKALKNIANIKDRVISFKIQKGLDFVYRHAEDGLKQRPNVFYYDNLNARNVWSKQFKEIKDCTILEKSFKTVLTEVDHLLENIDGGIWKRNRTPNGSWDVLHLINQGSPVQENQALCPQTMDIINSLSSVMKDNVFGNVMFSVLKPGTEITPHYGPTNIRLRCHLALQVPADCSLTVDGETLSWELGKCLLFDDSFLHSVSYNGHMSNKSSQTVDRVVLIVDLWHPDLSSEEREALNMCFQL